MHSFLYSLTICLLHYYPRHVSSINIPIFRRKNCIHTASGIFALCKRLHSPVMNGWYRKHGFTLKLKNKALFWQVTACYMQNNLFSSMTELCNFLPPERQPASSMFLENMHNLYIIIYSSLTKTVVTRCSSSFLVHLATIFYELNLRRPWLRFVEAVIYIMCVVLTTLLILQGECFGCT